MSRAPSKKSAAAAVLFVLLAAAASLAGWPNLGGGEWPELEQELRETRDAMLRDARFHQPLQPPDFPEGASFCGECHSLPPHSGNGVAEILLNHHAYSFDCLVCHWASSEGASPDPVWSRTRPGAGGGAEAERRFVLRLAPAGGGSVDLPAMRGRVISRRVCFDRGGGCGTCHRKGGMARFAGPGLTAQAAESLEKLPDLLTPARGARWYFPQRR